MAESAHGWAEFVDAWELFRDPVVCGAVAGAVLGFLGVYVFLRRMVFVSAAITQSAGLGVALAFYAEIFVGVHVDPIVGAALLSLTATLALSIDAERLALTREGVLGLVFAGSGALAIIVGARIAQEAHDIQAILFGTAVLVERSDLWAIVLAGGALMVLHLWWYRGISFASFDPVAARVQGLPVRWLNAFVLLSVGLMVGIAARALGALPVFALSTLPAMAALLLTSRLQAASLAATLIGAASGAAGYLMAFFYELPVGASQTAVAAALVALAMVLKAARGLSPITRHPR
jgi:zinc transport system permease protein